MGIESDTVSTYQGGRGHYPEEVPTMTGVDSGDDPGLLVGRGQVTPTLDENNNPTDSGSGGSHRSGKGGFVSCIGPQDP